MALNMTQSLSGTQLLTHQNKRARLALLFHSLPQNNNGELSSREKIPLIENSVRANRDDTEQF
jgi:hypothetical protein